MDLGVFEKLMKKWASREWEGAPEIKPTEEVRRKVRGKRRPFQVFAFPIPARWAAGIAIAATVLLVFLNRDFVFRGSKQPAIQPSSDAAMDRAGVPEEKKKMADAAKPAGKGNAPMKEAERPLEKASTPIPGAERPPGDAYAPTAGTGQSLGQTNAPMADAARPLADSKASEAETAPPVAEPKAPAAETIRSFGETGTPKAEKGSGRTARESSPIVFQYRREGDPTVRNIIIPIRRETEVVLEAGDEYRLVFQPDGTWYAAVFYRDSLKTLLRLFPNEQYSSVSNPFGGMRSVLLPEAPEWFPREKDANEGILCIVVSQKLVDGPDALYEEYCAAATIREKEKIFLRWLSAWTSLEENKEEILFWSRIKIRSS